MRRTIALCILVFGVFGFYSNGAGIETSQKDLETNSLVVRDWIFRSAIRDRAWSLADPGQLFQENQPERSRLVKSLSDTFSKQVQGKGTSYSRIIIPISEKYGVDWRLVTAIIAAESNFDPDATSPKGAVGLMQVMPETAQLYKINSDNLYDPETNVRAGVRHLRMLSNRYNGDLSLTVAAYHAGEGAVDKFGGVPPYKNTRLYVKRVLAYHTNLRIAAVEQEAALSTQQQGS